MVCQDRFPTCKSVATARQETVDKTHALKLEHIQWLLDSDPDVLIIATGWEGGTKPSEKILDLQDCEVILLRTGDAVKRYNKLKSERKRVSIHVHSTC